MLENRRDERCAVTPAAVNLKHEHLNEVRDVGAVGNHASERPLRDANKASEAPWILN